MLKRRHLLPGAFLLLLHVGCAGATPAPEAPGAAATPAPAAPMAVATPASAVPGALNGMAVVVAAGEADYARADLGSAVKPAGEGGLMQGVVVRLTRDVTVWRMWSGPAKRDERGNTNRMGQWWSFDAPRGTQQQYRQSYEICASWNDLTWMARCTLKKGAVVAVGPGNSVTPKTCGDASGKEAYPVNDRDWQLWLSRAWTRAGADKEIDRPGESNDYEPDPDDISRARGTRGGQVVP